MKLPATASFFKIETSLILIDNPFQHLGYLPTKIISFYEIIFVGKYPKCADSLYATSQSVQPQAFVGICLKFFKRLSPLLISIREGLI